MQVMHPVCCGIDVHQKSIVCCILDGPLTSNEPKKYQTSCGTTTKELKAALDWILEHQVTHVFFESTGQYWIPLFNIFSDSDLELEKYNRDKIQEYKKVRWIEFFGNQPYTQNPEKILEQADRIVSRVDWTKEEREMYDERTRYLQAYSSFLATIEKEKKDARMEGLTEGRAEGKVEGIEQGKKMMIISLIKDGLLSKEDGAKQLSISVIELDECMSADE